MSSSTGRVSAIVVHYRTPDDTVEAAQALAATVSEVEIVVVDKASGDAIARRLSVEVPAARLLVEPENPWSRSPPSLVEGIESTFA
jgi:GT2 family glycosyltransferase